MVGERLWRRGVWWLGLVGREYLRLDLHLLVDDLLHGSHEDVDHDELAMEAALHLGEEHPFKSQIQSFPVQEVFQRIVEYLKQVLRLSWGSF